MEHSFLKDTQATISGREMERIFMALSDETRRNILVLLEDRDRAVGEIVSNFHLSQPTISRHLSVLREANLVTDERQGQRVIYSLNGDVLARSMRRFFGNFHQCRDEFRAGEEASEATRPTEAPAWKGGAIRRELRAAMAMAQPR